jgi:hypothetical protein
LSSSGPLTVTPSGPARDLAVLAERAARHEATTLVRLVADGDVLAAFVATPFDCLGVRATRLSHPASLDVVVEAVGLAARARATGPDLVLPPPVPALSWTEALPPRQGWSATERLPVGEVRERVAEDTARFQQRAADVPAGRAARAGVEAIANDLWAQSLRADYPARLAHAASYLGFLPSEDDAEVVLRSAGLWRRLDTSLGVTAVRTGDLLGLLSR